MSGGTPGMTDSGRYYRNSEEVPLGGGVLAIACAAAVASVLATVYAQLLNPNNFPSAELNVLATCAFGAGIGWTTRIAAVQGNIRSQSFPRIVGGLIGIGALYLSWVSYVSAVVPDGIPAGSAVYSPAVLAGIVADIAREGVWVLERWHPTGAQLGLIWTVEAALIVSLATVVAGSSRRPFCEACQCWTEKNEPVMLAYRRQDKLVGLLEAGTYELLEALRRWPINPENYLSAALHCCPRCRESNYLSIDHIELIADAEGKLKKQRTRVMTNLHVSEEAITRLHAPLIVLQLPEEPEDDEGKPAARQIPELSA